MRLMLRLLVVALVAAVAAQAVARDARAGGDICVDFYPTMDPLAFGGGCYEDPGPDGVLVVGRAIVDDHYAPIDAQVVAYVEDIGCGVASMGFRTFELVVGRDLLCGAPGYTVRFEIDGRLASQTLAVPATPSSPVFLGLTSMPDHAWYWSERLLARPPAIGTPVQALVDGAVCGETAIDVVPFGFPIFLDELRGFWKLVVPADCGGPGTEVSFAVHDAHTVATVPWQPGVQQIDLTLAGDPNCDLVVASTDAALVLQLQAGLLRHELDCQPGADANVDGSANAIDASLVLQFAAGLLDHLPPG